MAGKNSKQTSTKTETPVAPKVEETKVTEPVQQKGGKKVAKVEENTPVVAKVEETKTESVPQKAQKGGKKNAKVDNETKVETPVAQKGGKKAESTVVQKGVKKAVEETKVEAPVAQKGGKKMKAKKVEKEDNEDDEDNDQSNARRIRSFKVKLPGKEDFEGRFTGLTPYQAANKALSKYFREASDPKAEITFSICESTRKSKKGVYTYAGKRLKLETPVTYKIQDGREIVKNFKNFLKKVKKSETVTV